MQSLIDLPGLKDLILLSHLLINASFNLILVFSLIFILAGKITIGLTSFKLVTGSFFFKHTILAFGLSLFKTLILKSYGEVSEDGESFIKDPELTRKFEKTEAYSELFMSLVTDTDKAVAFIEGIMPNINDIKDKVNAEIERIKNENNKVVSIEEK